MSSSGVNSEILTNGDSQLTAHLPFDQFEIRKKLFVNLTRLVKREVGGHMAGHHHLSLQWPRSKDWPNMNLSRISILAPPYLISPVYARDTRVCSCTHTRTRSDHSVSRARASILARCTIALVPKRCALTSSGGLIFPFVEVGRKMMPLFV